MADASPSAAVPHEAGAPWPALGPSSARPDDALRVSLDAVEDRKQAEALLAGEKRLLEMVARGAEMRRVLEALCTLVEETDPGSRCSILLVDGDQRLRHIAAPSLPTSYTDGIEGSDIHRCRGPCAVAALHREPVVAADFLLEDRWSQDYRDRALQHGLRACWSSPIETLNGGILGTFAVYHGVPGAPTPRQLDLIQQFTDLASIAIERSLAAEALRRSEANLARAQQLSATGSFSWRPDTKFATLSDETCCILGVAPGSPLTGKDLRDRFHPEDVPLFRDILAGTGSEFKFDCRLLMPDRSVKYVQVAATAVRDGEHRLVEWVGAVRDVTERRLSEDALNLMRAELAHVARVTTLGELTASIAHEVSQPLSGIVINGNAALLWLAADPPNLPEARSASQRIIRDAHRANEVITRLRSLFQRTGASKEPLDIDDIVHEVLALTRTEVRKAEVVVQTRTSGGLPRVRGDRVQLQQVLLNLVLNATEAMCDVQDRPREMHVATERAPDDGVCVLVQDSGPGIAAVALDRIFDAFHTTKTHGMGMGLAISRSIIEDHGGRIWATSGEGGGATLTFTLPPHR